MFAAADLRRRGAAGFTLLEMLVALSVALVLLAAAPRLAAPTAGDLTAAERLVKSELRRAREAALTTGADHAVLFGLDPPVLRRDGADPAPLPAGVALSAVTAAEVQADRGAPGVVFFGAGGATGGDLALTRGQATVHVQVRWLTGAIVSPGPYNVTRPSNVTGPRDGG